MAGANQTPNWQDKELRKLEGLIHDDNFKADIATLPSGDFETRLFALKGLTEKYGLSEGCVVIINRYSETGKLEPQSSLSAMSVICDYDETAGPADNLEQAQYNYTTERGFKQPGVSLFIPPGTSPTELKSFVKTSWPYIEAKLLSFMDGKKPKRERRRTKAERDAEVMRLHKKGHKNANIADVVNRSFGSHLIDNDISKIIEKRQDFK